MSHDDQRGRGPRPGEQQGHLVRELLEGLFKPLLREVVDEKLRRINNHVIETNERIDELMATVQELTDSLNTLSSDTSNALADISTQIQALNDRITELSGQVLSPEQADALKAQVDTIDQAVKAADPNPNN